MLDVFVILACACLYVSELRSDVGVCPRNAYMFMLYISGLQFDVGRVRRNVYMFMLCDHVYMFICILDLGPMSGGARSSGSGPMLCYYVIM